MSENKFQEIRVKIPMSWVKDLEAMCEEHEVSPEQILLMALGEELARREQEQDQK